MKGITRISRDEIVDTLFSSVRFSQFLAVGIIGMVIDNVTLAFMVDGIGQPMLVSALCSKELSIATMFLLNDRWTFSTDRSMVTDRSTPFRRFLKSNAVRAFGAGVGIAVLTVLTTRFGVWYLLANIIGIGVGFVFNFVFESVITWSVFREGST